MALSEAGRAALPGDDLQRGHLQRHVGAYEELLRLALEDHARAPGEAAAWAVLQALERWRARTLRDRLGPAAAERAASNAPAGRTEDRDERAARERLDWLYRRLNRFLHEDGEPEAPAALQHERRALEQAWLERARRWRLAAAGPSAAQSSGAAATGIDASALAAALGDGRALVAYGEIDGELLAVSVVAGQVAVHHPLAPIADLRSALRALHAQLATLRLGHAVLQRHAAQLTARTRRCLQQLHGLVWRPLAPALQGVHTVLLVPGAALASLPFAALWDGRRHLVEDLQLGLLASAELLLRGQAPPAAAPAAAATAGAPGGVLPAGGEVLVMADTLRLPGAAAEAAALAACWPQARVHAGPAATRAALRRDAPMAAVLHLACHGEFRADSPLFSTLHLHDGALTALDAEGLALAGPLVALGACESARADATPGDEAIGLVRAFLVAGASRVLGGLWAIDDEATARWMAAFHERLALGQPPAQALAGAQRRFIAEGAHPFQWAPFVLHGGA